MCGIAGIVNVNGQAPDRALLLRIRDTLVHRGPDDAGIYLKGCVGLALRRLSIVDLTSAGHQPMSNEDGTVWLVFNGEIYNYVELAAELRVRGHSFRSRTDSETIIHLYEEEGEECVRRLNGMFAFAIWDERKQMLFAARDRFGIKPFHYSLGKNGFVFASEMKALLEHPAVSCRPSYEGLADYLFAGTPLGTKTVFADIVSLEPGHTLTFAPRDGRLSIHSYWDLRFEYRHDRSSAQVEDELCELIDDAVRIQCRSDATLGCHLSGGLDSSTIVSFAARHRRPLQTFTVSFKENSVVDESAFARAVARNVGVEDLYTMPDAHHLFGLFAALVWHMDMPLPNEGAFAYFTVSEFASRHVKVALTGHGGDEVFAGYPAQFQAAFGSTAMFELPGGSKGARTSRIGELRWLQPAVLYRALRRRLIGRLHLTALERLWMQLHCNVMPEVNPLLDRKFLARLQGYSPVPEYLKPLRSAATNAVLDRCLYHDLRSYLPGLLHMEDRVSMAVSLESRIPLLDHRVVEFMATVPPEQKVPALEPKHLLRRVASHVLPAEIVARRDKLPFPTPTNVWFSGSWAKAVASVLQSPASLDRGIFDPDLLRDDRMEYSTRWSALTLELWFRIFVDRDADWLKAAQSRTWFRS
jgi:asparagine synthase (glutamine-hydrolysing)